MTPNPRHLLTVWNPSYTDDALDTHLSVLLKWSDDHAADRADREDVYVWWAKIRSKNRDGQLPHHGDVMALDEQIRQGVETHLYLTDYRSLYVAEIGEITDDDVREMDGELEHMPDYYAGHAIDFWFRLFDLRRLITGDTVEVIAELMSRELRDNVFGRELWPRLEPATRSFLASAETEFRTHRDEPGFDLSGAAVSYAKAVETELNALLFPALGRVLRDKPSSERTVGKERRQLDLGGSVPHETLGTIRHLLEHEDIVQAAVRKAMPHDHSWTLGVLPRELGPIVDLRNAGAHSETTSASALDGIRRKILGVGSEGLLGQLVRVGLRSRKNDLV